MDRVIVYPSAIPLETDVLSTNKNGMIGVSKLAHTVLGDGPWLQGLAVTPNSPAALNVLVAPGQIYSIQNIDGTAYSSIAADTAHTILKQGVSLDIVTLSTPAPATAGFSVNYLVQIAYQDIDGGATVLPYYNASNPAVAYSGPNNSGTANNTVRKGACVIAAKAGASAATGTQVTPAPDAGYIGAYVVTVANGATTVTAPNIVLYAGAPFITETLTQKISQPTGDTRYAKLAGLSTQQFSVANATAVSQAVALGQFVNSLTTNGYAKLPNGLILQWGSGTVGALGAGTTLVASVFPITFPNACLLAATVNQNQLGGNLNTVLYTTGVVVGQVNIAIVTPAALTSFQWNYVAIGY